MDPMSSTIQGDRSGQVYYRAFGCTVTRRVLLSNQAEYTGYVDDPASITVGTRHLSDHLRRSKLAAQESALGIHRHRRVPL